MHELLSNSARVNRKYYDISSRINTARAKLEQVQTELSTDILNPVLATAAKTYTEE